jgi:hypothetical protein
MRMMSDVLTPRRATPQDAPACAGIVLGWLTRTAWMKNVPDVADLTEMMAKGTPMREFWVIGDPVAGYLSVEDGRDYLQLWTHGPNTDAHRYYHREGSVTVEEKPEGRGDGLPELRMEWRR